MNDPSPIHVLYLAAQLPKQSETFVYREVLGLRERGQLRVSVATVHAATGKTGDAAADALADEAIQIYAPGKRRLLIAAAKALLRTGGWRTLWRGLADALTQRDVPLASRPKVVWQCLAGLALAQRVRGRGIDHLHSHMAHVPTTIAMYAAMALGVSFSFTGHAADLFRDRCLLEAKLRRARRIMCISHWHRRFYQGIADLADDRLPVVRCAVQVSAWRSAATPTTTPPAILAVGRLVAKKGFDVLIRSIAKLRDTDIAVSCTIVGEGPEQRALQDLINELDLHSNVHLTGALPNEAVRRLMQRHALFALPCRVDARQDRDGIPVVLMEAMACGAAVVGGDLATIRELIDHGVNGMLVPPDDADALAKALKELLADESLRQRLSLAARRTIVDEFSLDLNLDRLETALAAGHIKPSHSVPTQAKHADAIAPSNSLMSAAAK